MRLVLYGALAAAFSLPLAAQFGGPSPHGIEFGGRLHGGHQKLVTGAPYSATVTNTMVEHLADGNTIQRSTTGQVARDSQGRTYEMQTVEGGRFASGSPKTLIFVSDPVAGYRYVIDQTDKTVVRTQLHTRSGSPDSAGGAESPGHVHSGPDTVTADLGQDSSTGVVAQGTSITHTTPAGQVGNSAPLVSTVQRWYSPELQIVVKSVRNDPRFGVSTYALSGIVRAEPEPALFQIPAGYKVFDGPAHSLGHGPRSE